MRTCDITASDLVKLRRMTITDASTLLKVMSSAGWVEVVGKLKTTDGPGRPEKVYRVPVGKFKVQLLDELHATEKEKDFPSDI